MRLLVVTALLAVAAANTVTVSKSSSAGGASVDGQSFHSQEESSSTNFSPSDSVLDTRFNSRRRGTSAPNRAAAAAQERTTSRTTRRPTRRTTRRSTRRTTRRPRPATQAAAEPQLSATSFAQGPPPLHVPTFRPLHFSIPTIRPFGSAAGAAGIGNRFNNRRPSAQSAAAVPGGSTISNLQGQINQIGQHLASIQAQLGM